jgi:hypothetical protein
VTDLYIDFYVVVEAAGEEFRLNLDAIDYENTIETDIFDNKDEYPTGTDNGANEPSEDGSDEETSTETSTDDGVISDPVTDGETTGGVTETPTDDGVADGTL